MKEQQPCKPNHLEAQEAKLPIRLEKKKRAINKKLAALILTLALASMGCNIIQPVLDNLATPGATRMAQMAIENRRESEATHAAIRAGAPTATEPPLPTLTPDQKCQQAIRLGPGYIPLSVGTAQEFAGSGNAPSLPDGLPGADCIVGLLEEDSYADGRNISEWHLAAKVDLTSSGWAANVVWPNQPTATPYWK